MSNRVYVVGVGQTKFEMSGKPGRLRYPRHGTRVGNCTSKPQSTEGLGVRVPVASIVC